MIDARPLKYSVLKNRPVSTDGDTIKFPGIDLGGKISILARHGSYIAFKSAGGTHWTGIGMDWAYHSPTYYVIEITPIRYEHGYSKVLDVYYQENSTVQDWRHVKQHAIELCLALAKGATHD